MNDELRPGDVDRILAYEDLGDSGRRSSDRLLAVRPDLAAKLERLREIERRAQAALPLADDDGFWTADGRSGSDDADCRESARRTRAALGIGSRSWLDTRWLLPAAAVLAALVLLPLQARRGPLMTGLKVETVTTTRDDTRGPAPIPLTEGRLRTGEAVVLAVDLEDDAYVAVVHVDPQGVAALIYPPDTSRVERLVGGRRHHLPDPGSAGLWILDGATGTESFLVATDRETAPVLAEIRDALAACTDGLDRAASLAAARSLLEETWDQVELVEFLHVD
jgi:hypothetical protein